MQESGTKPLILGFVEDCSTHRKYIDVVKDRTQISFNR